MPWSRVGQMLALVELELRRIAHDPTEVFTRAVQPVLWLTVFGTTMSRLRAIPTGGVDYLTYIAPGVVLQSASFISLAYGIMLVWERESGILKKLLSSPIERYIVVLGRALAGAVRALTQLFIVVIVALLAGARLSLNPLAFTAAVCVMLLGCAGLTGLSIILAAFMKTRERFMGILQAIVMPLFFASNAIYPLELMPEAVRAFAIVNPLTYIISALRALMVFNDFQAAASGFAFTLGFFCASILAASAYLSKIIE